jgi:hypothetical protein
MYVEKLQQQWKSSKAMGQLSEDLLWKLLQQLTDGLPSERVRRLLGLHSHRGR